MPWQEMSRMDQREEFVRLAVLEGVNRRELCRRFGISSQTGYKWLRSRRWVRVDKNEAARQRDMINSGIQ